MLATMPLITIWGRWLPEDNLELFDVIDETQASEIPQNVGHAISDAQRAVGPLGEVKRIDLEVPVSATQVEITDLRQIPNADVYVIAVRDGDDWWTADGVDALTIAENEEALVNAMKTTRESVGIAQVSVFPLWIDLAAVRKTFDPPVLSAASQPT